MYYVLNFGTIFMLITKENKKASAEVPWFIFYLGNELLTKVS